MSRSVLSHLAPTEALRNLPEGETPRVTPMELFFDLVYVFSIIQLSHFLLEHQTWTGALQAATLFAAIWWAWNYTAWAANWVNPDHRSGRWLMVVLMACALLMAAAMPSAYSERAGLFVGAYVAMALIRAGYMALAFHGQRMGRNYAQLGAWSAFSGLFWIAGVFVPEARMALWLIAVLVDYAAPYAGFWLPGAGSTPMESWPLRGLHLLERNQLIFIIALGESILLLGGMLVHQPLSSPVILAAAVGFLLIVSLWLLYFLQASEKGEHTFASASDHTRLARAGLAYAHGIMVCGAIVVAVSIEQIIAHPNEAIHAPTAIIAASGPVLFLLGSALFLRTMAKRMPLSYLLAAAAILIWCWIALIAHLSGIVLGLGVLALLMILAAAIRQKAHGAAA